MAQLIEAETIGELGLTVAFLYVKGTGFRVATAGGGDHHTRHYSIAKARRLANELAEADPALKPAAILIRSKCDRLEWWLGGRDDACLDEFVRSAPEALTPIGDDVVLGAAA